MMHKGLTEGGRSDGTRRAPRYRSLFALLVLVPFVRAAAGDAPLSVGYVNALRVGNVSNLNYEAVDVVVHGFMEPLSDGGLAPLDLFATYREPLLAAAHARGKRVVLSVGGALPTRMKAQFAAIASNAATRAVFASNIVTELEGWGYDGVDIDYEFPSTPQQKTDFTLLMQDVYAAVKALDPDRLVIFGVSTGYYIDQYEWDRLGACSDLAFYFGYEWRNPANGPVTNPGQVQWTCGGNQIEASVRGALHFMREGGYPLDKVICGMPFYSANYASWYGFADDWATNRGAWTVHADYLEVTVDGDWWTTPESLHAKMDALLDPARSVLTNAETVAGVGFWEFGHEDPAEPDLSHAIHTWRSLRNTRFSEIGTAGSNGVVRWPVQRGIRYVLEQAPALDAAWTPAATAAPTAPATLVLTNAAETAARFYRLRSRLTYDTLRP